MPKHTNETSSLKPFFEPKSAAIIGASRTPGKLGYNILGNLIDLGFRGKIYPVNPEATEILGLKAYPRVDLIPEDVDVAVVATPASTVLEIMEGCARKRVKGVVIISSGFSEEGNTALEEKMLRIAKEAGIRIVGPNTTGILNTANGFTSSFVPGIGKAKRGHVAVVAQTGVFLGFLLDYIISSQQFGLSKVAGLGNKCDVDDVEVLNYLEQDPETKVICMYIEGVKDGRSFLTTARRVSKRKPILVLKSGVTERGSKVATSHTGSLAGRSEIFDAACKQAGIIRVESFEQLIDFAKAFALQPLPKGNNLGVMSITGAGCVIAADSAIKNGFRIPDLSSETIEVLRKISPPWHERVGNPVDLGPAMEVGMYSSFDAEKFFHMGFNAVLQDKNLDSLIVLFFSLPGGFLLFDRAVSSLLSIVKETPKPLFFSITGDKEATDEITKLLESKGFPVYPDVTGAVKAMSAMYQYYKSNRASPVSAPHGTSS
ncbi:MAG: Acyl-CoA synthetase (NDP forming) [Candidatus Bathyarchaeota archaeon BA2]|nr:MAG: Acyl-CoA synthetase (NDP forming) [Candidatus Bathyarchaeota archaeon BA2]